MWFTFDLAAANKWSQIASPTRVHLRLQLDVKNELNLVSKISLLGDDRKEPESAD